MYADIKSKRNLNPGIPGYIKFTHGENYNTKDKIMVISGHGNGAEGYGKNAGIFTSLLHYMSDFTNHLPYMLKEKIVVPPDDVFVICPQTNGGWLEGPTLINLIEHLKSVYEPSKTAFMGLSASGKGVLKAVEGFDSMIDIAIPIVAAYGYKEQVDPGNISVWAFTSWNDNTFRNFTLDSLGYLSDGIRDSFKKAVMDKMRTEDITTYYDSGKWTKYAQNLNGRLKATVFEKGGHSIWPKVYKMPELWQWIVERAKNPGVIVKPVLSLEEQILELGELFDEKFREMNMDIEDRAFLAQFINYSKEYRENAVKAFIDFMKQ